MSMGAFDAACFHAQQSAEKYLKAYLAYVGAEYPFTHNLAKLAELCAGFDPAFREIVRVVEPLTPFAVEMRYDSDFWPSAEVAEEARSLALEVKRLVTSRLAVKSD